MPNVSQDLPGASVYAVDVPSHVRSVIMTYDDGPEPEATSEVLDALDEFGARATFFVLISRAERAPQLLDQIVARGHELALHGYDHRRLSLQNEDEVATQLRDAKARLEEMAKREIRWFRPPYGDQTVDTWSGTIRAGLIPVMWTAEARDWDDVGEDTRVRSASSLAMAGGIVLSHDSFPDATDGVTGSGSPPAVHRGQLTRAILRAYSERGFGAITLGEAIALGRPLRRVWVNRE
jgi:peptidoglycan/xylan/chitin deacetylase (PgdA/CDA1 family)